MRWRRSGIYHPCASHFGAKGYHRFVEAGHIPPLGPGGSAHSLIIHRQKLSVGLHAIEAAEYLKYKHPHAQVTVHDRETGDTITIKALPPGRAP